MKTTRTAAFFAPSFVRVDEQIEERLPMLRAATRIQRAPLLRIERRRRPTRSFEKSHQFLVRNFLARHRPRRPPIDQKRLDR
jgi:hypothetical protein